MALALRAAPPCKTAVLPFCLPQAGEGTASAYVLARGPSQRSRPTNLPRRLRFAIQRHIVHDRATDFARRRIRRPVEAQVVRLPVEIQRRNLERLRRVVAGAV